LRHEKGQEMMSWYFCVDKYFGVIILCWLKRAEDDVNGEEDDVNGEKNWQWGWALEHSSTLNG
jgi:hypothetical protein